MLVDSYNLSSEPGYAIKLDISFLLKSDEADILENLLIAQQKRLDLEIVEKEMNKFIYKPISTPKEHSINPCKEIKLREFFPEYPGEFVKNTTPHSQRTPESQNGPLTGQAVVRVTGRKLEGRAELTDETIKLIVNVPGIRPERVQVRRVNNILRVFILDETTETEEFDILAQSHTNFLEYFLAEGETVSDASVELGQLTVLINRNAEVEEFPVE